MNEGKRVVAHATVQVTVELRASTWGSDCSIGQLYRQAGDSSIQTVTRMINESKVPMRIVGEPKVTGIITQEAE